MLLLKVQSDNIYHKTKFSHTLCEIWIIPKLCPPLSPFASKSGGSCPPSSCGSAAHVCTLIRQRLAVYKYNIKRSNIYSMYKMCTDNNKIRLLQHERASNSQVLGLSDDPDTLSDQCQPTCCNGSAKYHSITQSSNSETSQHMRRRHFSISHVFLCNSWDNPHSRLIKTPPPH